MAKRWLYLVVRQKEESPVVNFSLTHEAIPMLEQHQDSLLPRFAQGEEGHETTTKFPCLVCVDRVSHTVDIHLSDTKIAVRDSLQRRTQGGGGFHGLRIR